MSLCRFSVTYVCGPTSVELTPHLVSKVTKNCDQGPITCGVMSLHRFSNFAILENFITDFSGTMKTRKLKAGINRDNDWMYRVYSNRGHGSITLGVMSLGRFSKN